MQNLVGRKFLAPMISIFALVVYMSVYWSNSVYEAEISNLKDVKMNNPLTDDTFNGEYTFEPTPFMPIVPVPTQLVVSHNVPKIDTDQLITVSTVKIERRDEEDLDEKKGKKINIRYKFPAGTPTTAPWFDQQLDATDVDVLWKYPVDTPTTAPWFANQKELLQKMENDRGTGNDFDGMQDGGVIWAKPAETPTTAPWAEVIANASPTNIKHRFPAGTPTTAPWGTFSSKSSPTNLIWRFPRGTPTSAPWAEYIEKVPPTQIGVKSSPTNLIWRFPRGTPTSAPWAEYIEKVPPTQIGVKSSPTNLIWRFPANTPTSAPWAEIIDKVSPTNIKLKFPAETPTTAPWGVFVDENSPTNLSWKGERNRHVEFPKIVEQVDDNYAEMEGQEKRTYAPTSSPKGSPTNMKLKFPTSESTEEAPTEPEKVTFTEQAEATDDDNEEEIDPSSKTLPEVTYTLEEEEDDDDDEKERVVEKGEKNEDESTMYDDDFILDFKELEVDQEEVEYGVKEENVDEEELSAFTVDVKEGTVIEEEIDTEEEVLVEGEPQEEPEPGKEEVEGEPQEEPEPEIKEEEEEEKPEVVVEKEMIIPEEEVDLEVEKVDEEIESEPVIDDPNAEIDSQQQEEEAFAEIEAPDSNISKEVEKSEKKEEVVKVINNRIVEKKTVYVYADKQPPAPKETQTVQVVNNKKKNHVVHVNNNNNNVRPSNQYIYVNDATPTADNVVVVHNNNPPPPRKKNDVIVVNENQLVPRGAHYANTCQRVFYQLVNGQREAHISVPNGRAIVYKGPIYVGAPPPNCVNVVVADDSTAKKVPVEEVEEVEVEEEEQVQEEEEPVMERVTPECPPVNVSAMEEFHAPSGEDEAIYEIYYTNPLKTCGTIVEVGAKDGDFHSKSYFFEHALHWKTVLIEGNPKSYASLLENRPNAFNVNGTFCEGKEMKYKGDGFFEGSSAHAEVISELYSDTLHNADDKTDAQYIDSSIPCINLQPIFKANDISKIDIMYIAVNGDALAVIREMDWTIKVDIWVIELNGFHEDRDEVVRKVLVNNDYVAAEWDIRRWCNPYMMGQCMPNEVFLRKGFNPLPQDVGRRLSVVQERRRRASEDTLMSSED